MKYKILSILILSILSVFNPEIVAADTYVAQQSSTLNRNYLKTTDISDYRVIALKNYLESHNSPLSESAQNFIDASDKYDLDWRLVPAISGVESTFGKRIPQGSYNAYGWANGNYYFESWEDSIDHVSKTLREKYIDNGAVTIDQIARRYAPPSSTWSWKVQYFMNEIDPLPFSFSLES